jgi:hypothetical protein
LLVACATTDYSFIGEWEHQAGTLTYINPSHHLKISFPDYKWKICTHPNQLPVQMRQDPNSWRTPTREEPLEQLLIAIQDADDRFMALATREISIELDLKEASAQDIADLMKLAMKLKNWKLPGFDGEFTVSNRPAREVITADFGLKATFEGKLVMFIDKKRIIMIIYVYRIVAKQDNYWHHRNLWEIVDSYEYVD